MTGGSGGILQDGVKCWYCGVSRDIFGEGSRKCSYCGASDEAGWQRSPVIGDLS